MGDLPQSRLAVAGGLDGLAGVLALGTVLMTCILLARGFAGAIRLMCRHLRGNGLVSGAAKTVTTFNGAVWTHDSEVQFPDSDVRDIGPAVTAAELTQTTEGGVLGCKPPLQKLSTLCQALSTIDFAH